MSISEYFEAKKRLYPQAAKGRFRKLKWILNAIFLTIYLGSPFLRWDRGSQAPNQAILIDFPSSKGYFFGIEMWPNEVFYLMIILILAAVILFFITSLFGRIWCGYACFQTVWTDIFIALEKVFQGDRNARIMLDRKNSFEKFYKKSLTHLSWIVVAIVTGYGFTNYFSDAFLQAKNLMHLNLSTSAIGWNLGIAGATYIMAGFAREHVCTYMCPYSRFQSAMFDKNTLIITYDEKRGDPRGKHKQGDSFSNRGDCIDCKQCVVVCPTGIDIRNGLQMECIACGLCIDACDEVMQKIGRPKGLIRYDTERHLQLPSQSTKFKFFSARFFYYTTILFAVSSFLIYSLITKSTVESRIIADRNPAFVMLSDGSIRNGYNLKITNKTHEDKVFTLKLNSPQEAQIIVKSYNGTDKNNLTVAPNNTGNFKIYIILSPEFLAQNLDNQGLIDLSIIDNKTNTEQKISAIFVWK